MTYNWQQSDWPDFKYDMTKIEDTLLSFAEKVGRVGGLLNGLPEDVHIKTVIDMMVAEAINTSEIEGETLRRDDVMSSIMNNLGLVQEKEHVRDKRAIGAAELMIDVRNSFADKLTQAKLFSWHQMIMKGSRGVKVAGWRTHEDPMQVVSGAIGKRKVHFEAPPSTKMKAEMKQFIKWFKAKLRIGALTHAGIAHLYFVSIHPFEDGNGRIGRAIAEKSLSMSLGHPTLISLSYMIEKHRKDYYRVLELNNKDQEITDWLIYFAKTILDAQNYTQSLINFLIEKAKFYDRLKAILNERQEKVIERMFREGVEGFKGGLSAENYIRITNTSRATATRDLKDLVNKGALNKTGQLKHTRYYLNIEHDSAISA